MIKQLLAAAGLGISVSALIVIYIYQPDFYAQTKEIPVPVSAPTHLSLAWIVFGTLNPVPSVLALGIAVTTRRIFDLSVETGLQITIGTAASLSLLWWVWIYSILRTPRSKAAALSNNA